MGLGAGVRYTEAWRTDGKDLPEAGAGGAWLEGRQGWKAGQRLGGVCTGLRRTRDSENGLGAEPVPRLGHGVGWARKWGGVLVKLKGKGTD